MNSKELVFSAIRNEEVSRIPWVPFVGCHAAKLIDVSPREYFTSTQRVIQGVEKAYEEYEPDGLPILFDLQVEAEALGCKIQYSDDNPPAVVSHPLSEGVKLSELKVPTPQDARYPLFIEATKALSQSIGDKIALYGLITGPYTLALHLLGADLFYKMIDTPDEVVEIMEFCKKVCLATAKYYLDAGAHIIAVVDPMTSQISPTAFEDFVLEPCKEIFNFIRERGALSSFFVCGNAKRNVENMCKSGPDNVSIDENIPLDYVVDMAKKYDISAGGNIQLTAVMLLGTPLENIENAANCSSIGGKKGFILAPGCDMPYDTPIENVKAVTAFVHGRETEYLKNVSFNKGEMEDWDMPDYANEKNVIIDVITLDSESCAPCQYMMEAVVSAAKDLDGIEYVEHKIKESQSLSCMQKLGVQNIPTIVIDGVVKYISIIPDIATLKTDFEEAIAAKK